MMTETPNETRPTSLTTRQRRAQRLADLVAAQRAIEAEEAAADKAAEEALKRAGLARSRAVEELYDLLGINEETTTRARKDGTSRVVRTDRDETRRAARLVEAVVALVDRAGGMTEQPSRACATSRTSAASCSASPCSSLPPPPCGPCCR